MAASFLWDKIDFLCEQCLNPEITDILCEHICCIS